MRKTEAEWKRTLSDVEYKILREKGTERAFTGKYDGHFQNGVYLCAGCGNKIFDSEKILLRNEAIKWLSPNINDV